MTADRVVDLLDRIGSEKASLIQMKIAAAARKAGSESRTGGRKSFAHHVVAERLNNGDSGLFLRVEIMVPIGMEKKFIQIDETNPIGASAAFPPAGLEKGKVRVEIRFGLALEWPDLDFGRSAQKFDRTIGGMIVVDDDTIDERLIVPEEKWDNAFLIPAGGVKMDRHDDGNQRLAAKQPGHRRQSMQRSRRRLRQPRLGISQAGKRRLRKDMR